MEALSELGGEEVVWGVGEDEGGEAGVEPLGDDGSPVVDPGLDEVQVVAADEAEQWVAAGDGAAERGLRLAALGFGFGLGGGWRGEQGSAVEEDSVDVQVAQEVVERAFGWAVVEVVAMADLDGEWQFAREALKVAGERLELATVEGGAELQKRGAESIGVVQDRQQFEERDSLGFGAGELLVVTDRSRKLETEAESVRGLVGPAAYGVSAGQSIERAAPFDRVEDGAVLLQKVARLGIGCEERTNPRGAGPNRASQKQRRAGGLLGCECGVVAHRLSVANGEKRWNSHHRKSF